MSEVPVPASIQKGLGGLRQKEKVLLQLRCSCCFSTAECMQRVANAACQDYYSTTLQIAFSRAASAARSLPKSLLGCMH